MFRKFPTLKEPSILPGFAVTLGFTLFYLLLVVLVPLAGLFWQTAQAPMADIIETLTEKRTLHAFKVSFGLSLFAALINGMLGLLLAWVLVRYRFWGKRIIDAMVDLPFALPTAVAGIALAALYAPQGWIGKHLVPLGIQVAFTPLGILLALIFVGLPFVVRTVEPVLQDIDREIEEAAYSLGANRSQTFMQVLLPSIWPALTTGVAMAFARALGEYGSVIFIAGNLPGVSEIVPLLIVIQLEQYDYAAATAIATMMLSISFLLLLSINVLQRLSARREMAHS